MPTSGVINTTALAVYTGATPVKIASSTGGTLSVQQSLRNTNTKDSAGWETNLEGMRSWTLNCSGLVAFDDTNGFTTLFDSINNRTAVTVRISTEATGDIYFEGSAYVSSLDEDTPGSEENATYSVSFQGTGALTKGTVS